MPPNITDINRRGEILWGIDSRTCTACGVDVPTESIADFRYLYQSRFVPDECDGHEEAFIYCPRCRMGNDPEYLRYMMLGLLEWNPQLTGEQARDYARRIVEAEVREDYSQMHALIQEAVYGTKERNVA